MRKRSLFLMLILLLQGCAQESAVIECPTSIEEIPSYDGRAYIIVNDNIPYFNDEELAKALDAYEYYGPLDDLGRPSLAVASVDESLFPNKERGDISDIHPTGWKQVINDDYIEGGSLYTRTHLLAHMLTGEDANPNNLITGTRFMNEIIMLPFENMVKRTVEDSDMHVLYRIRPLFEDGNLVAEGLLLEAQSVEDRGAELSFCVFLYNVQPCFSLDYEDGESVLDKTCAYTQNVEVEGDIEAAPFIINTNTQKIHLKDCASVADIYAGNRLPFYENLEVAKALGYELCGNCLGV